VPESGKGFFEDLVRSKWRAGAEGESQSEEGPEIWRRRVIFREVVASKIRWSLEVVPARHRSEVEAGIMASREKMVRVESIGAVELIID